MIYEYRGFKYEPWEDVEPEECTKVFHDVIGPYGDRFSMEATMSAQLSSYRHATEEQFRAWVDARLGSVGE